MRILVHHDGQQLGPFDESDLSRALTEGRVRLEDLAWHEGLTTWVPLQQAMNSAFVYSRGSNGSAESSGMAIVSLVLGLATFFFCLLTGVPAIVFGHLARREIRLSRGRISGDGMAIAGLVFGYMSLAIPAVGLAIFLTMAGVSGAGVKDFFEQIVSENAARPQPAINATRQISQALKNYAADHGNAFPETLEQLVPDYLPDAASLRCPFNPAEENGYLYYGGKTTDQGDEPLLMTKGADEHERHVVLKKGGAIALKKETVRKGFHYNSETSVSE